jgi:hypothetical protein
MPCLAAHGSSVRPANPEAVHVWPLTPRVARSRASAAAHPSCGKTQEPGSAHVRGSPVAPGRRTPGRRGDPHIPLRLLCLDALDWLTEHAQAAEKHLRACMCQTRRPGTPKRFSQGLDKTLFKTLSAGAKFAITACFDHLVPSVRKYLTTPATSRMWQYQTPFHTLSPMQAWLAQEALMQNMHAITNPPCR